MSNCYRKKQHFFDAAAYFACDAYIIARDNPWRCQSPGRGPAAHMLQQSQPHSMGFP